jgi:hypothetical protein
MRAAPSAVERVRRALRATAVFLWMLAEALWRWAELLKRPNSKDQRLKGTAKNTGARSSKSLKEKGQ